MIYTDRIYGFTERGLWPRYSEITLDCDEVITDHEDMQRSIHVSGLSAGDFAVYL